MTFVAQARAVYDQYGRTEQVWDLAGAKRTTAYGQASGAA